MSEQNKAIPLLWHDELVDALKAVVAIANETWGEWDRDNDSRVGKLLIALSGKAPGYRPEIDAIHAVLAKAASPIPDYVYDHTDWECTYSWSDRGMLIEGLDLGEIKEVSTLHQGPSKWCVIVGVDPDEDGFAQDTETVWFDSEVDARAAVEGRRA